MSITATVVNGTIKLPEGTHLEDGTQVMILAKSPQRESFLERNRSFIGCIKDAPPDAADNHDHYLYGTARQKP